MRTRRPGTATMILVHAGLVLAVAVVLYPVLMVCKKAFEPGRQFALGASPLPRELTTANFEALFSARGGNGELLFLHAAFNSIVIAVATTIVGVVLSCTAAYALSRFKFPGRQTGLTMFLVVQMFPATLLLLPLYVILDTLAKSATITVDGKEIEGTELDVDLGTADKKSIKVVVKAAGYRSYEKTLSVEGDTDMQVEMTKRPASVPSGPRPGGGGGRKNGGNSGGGGLIDI